MKRHYIAQGDLCLVIEASTSEELRRKVQAFIAGIAFNLSF